MKKLLFMFVAATAFTFASCDSKKENAVEENAEMKEEAAEDAADAQKDAAEDAAEATKDSVDAVDPQ
ncbi:entericidin [Adhaeribacter swui]|uniref:Entericidin n=1 Tax=Adhaeribacter swui TaxID=2086471 RepID=A0A7G7G818_9BACT|nr:entericidin [Adhaeribacter swui]QNF33302.1 entericidin [Adhaeribacter swui]